MKAGMEKKGVMQDKARDEGRWVKGITPKRRWGIGLPKRKLPALVTALADPESTLAHQHGVRGERKGDRG